MPVPAPTTAPAAWRRDSSRSSERGIVDAVRTVSGQLDPAAGTATPPQIAACASLVSAALVAARPVALACDPCLEGVVAATGVTYLAHARPGQVRLAARRNLQPELGEEVVSMPASSDDDTVAFARRVLAGYARKVTQGCQRRAKDGSCPAICSEGCMQRLVLACASDDPAMPEVVHRYLRLGFAQGPRARTLIADPRVSSFDELARYVSTQCEHTRQFVRFSRLSDDSFLATFAPHANTIPLTAAHFAARMGPERFCLLDTRHLVAAFHAPGERDCTIARLDGALARQLASRSDLADDERYVRAMWQAFYQGTALPGRGRAQRGYDLRMHWMPQYFWEGLPELDPQDHAASPPVPARYAGGRSLPCDA